MNHPSMTTRGKRIAFVVAIAAALSLPKRVPCEVPGRDRCDVRDDVGQTCTPTDLEPLAMYLLELATHHDAPIAYRTWVDCR